MTRYIYLFAFVILLGCKARDEADEGANVKSYRYDNGQKVLDVGVYINDEPTTNSGELLPEEISWGRYPSGFSGDKVIGRTQYSTDNNLFEQAKSSGAKYVLKIKVVSDSLEDIPNQVTLSKGFIADTNCGSPESTVKIKGQDERGEEGVYNFCVTTEQSGKNAGAKIIYTNLSLISEGAIADGFSIEILMDRILGSSTQFYAATVNVTNLNAFENQNTQAILGEEVAFSTDPSAEIPFPTPAPKRKPDDEYDKMSTLDRVVPKKRPTVDLPDQKSSATFQNMMILPAGSVREVDGEVDMSSLSSRNKLYTGLGYPMGSKATEYCEEKYKSQNNSEYHIQWIIADIEDDFKVIDHSIDYEHNFYGASVVKSFTGAAWLDANDGKLDTLADLDLLIRMIRDSNNPAWIAIRKKIGEPSGAVKFTSKMGYVKTRSHRNAYDGYLGNQINARETAELFFDTYHGNYQGADVMWRIFHTCRTGSTKAKYYLPQSLVVGGKTGSWDESYHHALTFRYEDRQYAMVVLTGRHYTWNLRQLFNGAKGSNNKVAVMAGGLFREYIEKSMSCSN